MTVCFTAPGASLLDEDDVLPVLRAWRQQGLRAALVTLVGVEGGAPRQPGAQMAVAEDGRYVGYLSGGCLEQAVALEAKSVIADARNMLIRYGKGSPYFDIRLPCGSGLDLYFDQSVGDAEIQAVLEHRDARRTSILVTDLDLGKSTVEHSDGPVPLSERTGSVFKRTYPAPIRLVLIGNGPALSGIATLAKTAGVGTLVWTTDDHTRGQLLAAGVQATAIAPELDHAIANLDEASAAVVVFHDHEIEPSILMKLLQTKAFYLGVLGNRAVHRARREALAALGADPLQIDRLHAPVGTIPNAKSKMTFAFGVLTEMLTVAKGKNLVG